MGEDSSSDLTDGYQDFREALSKGNPELTPEQLTELDSNLHEILAERINEGFQLAAVRVQPDQSLEVRIINIDGTDEDEDFL